MENNNNESLKVIPLSTRRQESAKAYSAGFKSPKQYTEKGADGKMHGREIIVSNEVVLDRKDGKTYVKKTGEKVNPAELEMGPGGLFRRGEDGKVLEMENGKNGKNFDILKLKDASSTVSDDSFQISKPGGSKRIPANKAMGAFNGWVYAGVTAIAMDIATIEWRLFSIKDNDNHEEIFEHELLNLLDGVNEFQTGVELRFLMATHLELTGNCYLLKLDSKMQPVATADEKPAALYPLNPGNITMGFDKTSFPYVLTKYTFSFDGKKHEYKPWQLLHLKYPDPNDMYAGIGPVQAIASWIDVDNYATEYNRKFFLNGAHIDGMLQSDMTAEETIDVLRTSWEAGQTGIANAHKTPVLPRGVKYVATSASPKDMDFSNMDDKSRDKILAGMKVSKTILGTAESDTNRATAETADYVFAKRTIRPKMELICAYLNEFLVPLFGEDIYISYENPVPEDAEFRTKEMQAVMGNAPTLSINEARESYMGLGPVEGGDEVMVPTTMAPLGASRERSDGSGGGNDKPKEGEDDENEDENDSESSGKAQNEGVKRVFPRNVVRRHMSAKISRGAQSAKFRKGLGEMLADRVAQSLAASEAEAKKRENINAMTHDDYLPIYKEFLSRVDPYEKKIQDLLIAINKGQKEEVMENLEKATGVEKEKQIKLFSELFNMKKWVTITIDALTPVLMDLGEKEGTAAADLVKHPIPGSVFEQPEAKSALDRAVALMANTYNETVRDALKAKLDEGISLGYSYADLANSVSDIYAWQDEKAALRVARTESVRVANMTTKEAWKQTGVVKTIKWYTAEDSEVCEYCDAEDGTEIDINENFYNEGDQIDGGEDMPSVTADYGDVGGPPLHPNCRCYLRPEVIDTN